MFLDVFATFCSRSKWFYLLFYLHAKFPRAGAAAKWPRMVRRGALPGWPFGECQVAGNCPKRTPNSLNVPSRVFFKYFRSLFHAHAKFPLAEAAAEWPERVLRGARPGRCLGEVGWPKTAQNTL